MQVQKNGWAEGQLEANVTGRLTRCSYTIRSPIMLQVRQTVRTAILNKKALQRKQNNIKK